MRSNVVNGVLYAFVVSAAVAASAVVFLVVLEVRESMGISGVLGSLVAFPVTWLLGPVMLASGGDTSLYAAVRFLAGPCSASRICDGGRSPRCSQARRR